MTFLEDAFLTILNMSITASYAAIAVIIARLLLKKAPKVFSYALWSIVLFRLIYPFSFSSAFSLLGLIHPLQTDKSLMQQYIPQDIGTMAAPTVDTGVDSVNAAINASLPAATPLTSVNPLQVWITLGTVIWLIGVAVLLIYVVISYLHLKNKISMATLVSDNIYETDLIHSPFVCGFMKPKIYLPLSLAGQEREYILCHEQTHIKRFDYLIKPVAYLALVFHWFNPLMWLCFSLMTKDMEMSCDERVMQRRSSEEVAGYSSSLLALATPKKTPSPSPLAFGEDNVKARIKNILNHKQPTLWVIITSTIAVVILAVVLISNPIKGFSIYEHPETFLGKNSLRAPAKVHIGDHISGEEYILTDANEIAQVTAIVEDMRIAKKEISKARGGRSDSRYSISYYDDINDSISEYRYTVHAAPVWVDNNVKPSFRFNLINQKDILKRLEEVFAGKDGKAVFKVDTLLKNKTQYIGDNSRVIALIDTLPLLKGVKRDSVELSTFNAPYGVTINYNLEDDSVQISEEQFLRNSVLLLALIDNAEEITHRGYWNNKLLSSTPFKFTYTRADAERIVGGDVRQFAENQESLAQLIEIVQIIKDDNERD
ncbi:MAG: M56 family metallopeptidase [Bacillota bacterium]